jgi:hypothetical protein
VQEWGNGDWNTIFVCVWGGVIFRTFSEHVGESKGQQTILNSLTITKECSGYDLQTGEWVTECNRNDSMRTDEWRNEIG